MIFQQNLNVSIIWMYRCDYYRFDRLKVNCLADCSNRYAFSLYFSSFSLSLFLFFSHRLFGLRIFITCSFMSTHINTFHHKFTTPHSCYTHIHTSLSDHSGLRFYDTRHFSFHYTDLATAENQTRKLFN